MRDSRIVRFAVALGLLLSVKVEAAVQPEVTTLGSSVIKTNVMKTGTLVTTAVTADQVILTYTVTAGKTFFLTYWSYEARLTALSATGVILGTCSLETPSGTKVDTHTFTNMTTEQVDRLGPFQPAEGQPIASGAVIRIVCTPAAVTSTTWVTSFGGFEQ